MKIDTVVELVTDDGTPLKRIYIGLFLFNDCSSGKQFIKNALSCSKLFNSEKAINTLIKTLEATN